MKEDAYYDLIYDRLISDVNLDGWKWIKERTDKIVPLITGDSVLDLGCGLSFIPSMVDAVYVGIDISTIAIEWNMRHYHPPSNRFVIADITRLPRFDPFDTVLLLDVLEHLFEPARVYQNAWALTRKRMVVTVPRDMPGKKHYHPKWDESILKEMMGDDTHVNLFGGDEGNRWLLAVRDR